MARVKDEDHKHDHIKEGLSADLQAFTVELEQKFPQIRYTSGKRTAAQGVGKYSATSHHNTGNAMDIGAEHKDVYDWLYNTPEGLGLLTKYGLGIIDETTKVGQKATGATGAHYHIGKDSKYAQEAKQRFEELSKSAVISTKGTNLQEKIQMEIITPQGPVLTEISLVDFQREAEKVKKTEEKVEKSPARSKVEEKKEVLKELVQSLGQKSDPQMSYRRSQPQQAEGIPLEEVQLPRSGGLPNLPNIFNMNPVEMEEGGVIMDPPKKKLTPEQQKIANELTMQWLNENPYKKNDEVISLQGLDPLPGESYPMMTGDKIFVPQVGTFGPDQYVPATLPDGWQGHQIYLINNKPIVVDKDFNKEYFNLYQKNKLIGKDELFPVYGLGRPYKD